MQKYFQQLIQQIIGDQDSLKKELELYTEQWREGFDQLQQRLNESSSVTREALIILGENGWYVDIEGMTDEYLLWLADNFAQGNGLKAENTLIEHFERRLLEIETSIIGKFPHRAHLIRAAFRAHQSQEFELSIPVLLAQTDGICKEGMKQSLFIKDKKDGKKKNKKPCTAIYVEQMVADTFTLALLSPLTKTLPINASEKERLVGFSELNRHMILHGESLDYGNKVNSLKAISLLNYVVHVLEITKKP